MDIKPIKSETDYNEALQMLEALWEVEEGTEDFDKLDILATLVEYYEKKHHHIAPPDPVQAILFRMDQEGLNRSDMEEYLGSPSKVSEVLSYKRGLSITMIRNLSAKLGIPSEILIQSYPLAKSAA